MYPPLFRPFLIIASVYKASGDSNKSSGYLITILAKSLRVESDRRPAETAKGPGCAVIVSHG